MSQDFEKKVLEKLDHFEGRFDKIEKTLDEHTVEFKKVNQTLNEHLQLIKDNKNAIENNAKLIKNNSREIEGLKDVVNSHTASISHVNQKFDSVLDVVEVHKNLFVQFEYDFDLKFKTLMDFFSANQEKHKVYDDTLVHYNSKLLNHDIRILSLEEQLKQNIITA